MNSDDTCIGAGTVLVVDDEALIRQSVRDILEDDGFCVIEACNGEECCFLLDSHQVDLILMDIQMPGRNGMETFKEMIRARYKVETIMISGHADITTAVDAIKSGVGDFLEKPFSVEQLRKSVQSAFKRRGENRNMEISPNGQESSYEINDEIGRGGTATIYRAVQKDLDKVVALKMLHPHLTDPLSFGERFAREARILASMSHPHVIQVFDYGQISKSYYLAMEYVEGTSLGAYISRRRGVPRSVVALVGMDICRALEHAHAREIIHRDIKPENVLISRQGYCKLADFGIARWMQERGKNITDPDFVAGTAEFMSPEQVEGKKVDHFTDIFSTGVLLYVMMTGYQPFTGENAASIMYSIVHKEPVPPAEMNPKTGSKMNRIINKCLRKKKEKRFRSAAHLSKALESTLTSKECAGARRIIQNYFFGKE
ncbi:MAG: protein kinase [Chitinivibrionales bacterium]|nr:protein kinase [Chitinivibrionales bacterium]